MKKKSTPTVCRIASLHNFNNVLLGRDLAGIFESGHVYNFRKVAGIIMVEDLGEHAMDEAIGGATISVYATSGVHCLTKAEYEYQLNQP
ncbi:hypothetical protein IC229_33575 [Spirosoma sp. BT702]|uniref:Uncharacterized protein n=1 Tax=Spirosoma profusum TaxID=2771354 RepID=A0A927AWA1_9BACT|nr:hypothetical protein [Spirosoma profusum]MBD2705587.1 hypothetical protein [Spirosoma profusum]